MSVKLTRASSQYLSRASPLDYNADYTVGGWVRNVGSASTYWTVAELFGNANNLDVLYREGTTNKLQLYETDAGVASINGTLGATTITGVISYFIAIVRSGNALTVYLGTTPTNIAQEITGTGAPGTRVVNVATLRFGADETPANFADAHYTGWRAFTRALSLAELKTEAATLLAASSTNLWASWPLRENGDLGDKSGNSRDLTATGTVTTDMGVSIPLGAIGGGPWAAGPIMPIMTACL